MTTDGAIQMQGEVVESLPDAAYRVKLENGHVVLGSVEGTGTGRTQVVRILPGDRVTVEWTPNDMSRARIVFRAN